MWKYCQIKPLVHQMNAYYRSITISRKGNLQGKINGLSEKGILTKENASVLHEHRFLGNKAVHELAEPSRNELSLAIEIIEHILGSIYELPAKGSILKIERMREK